MDDLREIRLVCQDTGMYAHWLMTDAQGGTFVDVEMGMEPRTAGTRVFDAVDRRACTSGAGSSSRSTRCAARRRARSAPPAA